MHLTVLHVSHTEQLISSLSDFFAAGCLHFQLHPWFLWGLEIFQIFLLKFPLDLALDVDQKIPK